MDNYSRIDLHVHTRFSQTGDWVLSSLGIKESYTEPKQAYNLAMRRGMDFVTITDHDTIQGALQIAHLNNVFIGEEVTTCFPEDRARIHVVVLDINETQHQMIQSLRMNIYELVRYLNQERLLHFVAHPFFRMTASLGLEHFEKLLLLFKHFEVKNGGKQLWPDHFLQKVLSELTRETIFNLADQYDIEPHGQEPWVKYQVAGSDDHGGILIGTPHTRLPKSRSVKELLDHIRSGHAEAAGEGGNPLAVAHNIFSVAYHYFEKNANNRKMKSRIVWNIAGQIFNNTDPDRMLSFASRVLLALNEQLDLFGDKSGWKKHMDAITQEFARLVKTHPELLQFLHEGMEFDHANNEKLFAILSMLIHQSIVRILNAIDGRTVFKAIRKQLKWFRPVLPLLFIYLIAFKTEYRDRPLMRQVRRKYLHDDSYNMDRIVVFTDNTSREVVHTLVVKNYNHLHFTHDSKIDVIGLSDETVHDPDRHNYRSLCEFHVKNKCIAVPPVLDIIKQFSETEYNHIYLHSFGPMGILGLLIGKWLNIPVTCRYPGDSSHGIAQDLSSGRKEIPFDFSETLMKWVDHIKVLNAHEMEYLISMNIPMENIDLIQSPLKNRSKSFNLKQKTY